MSITVFKRYEKKFLTDAKTVEAILPILVEHMELDKFCKNGQCYHICNLYYDTDQNDVIRDSLQHPYYKEKLRMRSYGLPQSRDTRVFLELKKKVAGEVTKRRAKLTYDEAKKFLADRTYPDTDYLNRQILREVDYYLSHMDVHPQVFVSYDRVALFDKTDPSFRLTFDYNLCTKRGNVSFDDHSPATPLFDNPEFRLMEVKVSNAYPKWFADLINEYGIHRHSFSKFGVEYKTYLKNQVLSDETIQVLSHI